MYIDFDSSNVPASFFTRCVLVMIYSIQLKNERCIVFSGNQSVGYFYTRKKFGWDAPDWAFFVTLVSASSSFGIRLFFLRNRHEKSFFLNQIFICITGILIILPVLSGYFKVSDGIMGILSLLANIGAYLTIAFAVSPLMVYLCK